MSMLYGLSELDESDEAFDEGYDESDEAYDEAAPRRGARQQKPVNTAGRKSAYRPRPNNDFVTQAQLQAALARVSGQISTNSTAIKTLDGRVRGVTAEQARVTAALRKEIADRKKEADSLRKGIQSAKELSVILPIIAKDNPLLGLLAIGDNSLFGGSSSSSGDGGTSNLLMMGVALNLFK